MTKTLYVRPEHKETTQKAKKFDKKTGLFTGVSAAALMLGATGGSAFGASGGTTVTKPANSFVVGTKQQFDFVDIHAPISNNVINNGTIGPGDSPSLTIDGPNGGSVGGNIINNALISGTMAGIFVSSTAKNTDVVGGGIFNFGVIDVDRGTTITKASSAFGIVVSGPAVATTISNTGNISVSLSAVGTGHTAGGIKISSTGSLSSNIINSGTINVTGTALGPFPTATAQMSAFGIAAINTTGAPGPATSNVITNSPGGLIDVDALATASGPVANANATAVGAGQIGIGTSATANVMTISNAVSATISAFASASVFNSFGAANARALGAGQSATGGLSITQNVNNSGNINATASASATGSGLVTANASAGGVVQTASGSPSITQTVNNSGQINARAIASANAAAGTPLANANASNASALGVGQFASGGTGTVSHTLSITNSSQGSINVTASGFGFGTVSPDGNAFATGISQSSTGGGTHALTFNNSGALNVSANGTAGGVTNPQAFASGIGVAQSVAATSGAPSASVSFSNLAQTTGTTTFSGSLNVTGFASATGATTSNASALAGGVGVLQRAFGAVTNSASIANAGSLNIMASASATGSFAFASAGVTAINQSAGGGASGSVSFSNGGTVNVGANAQATAVSSATALAGATTDLFNQSASGSTAATASFTNSSSLAVQFSATAVDLSGSAQASAGLSGSTSNHVIEQNASSGGSAAANFANTGNLSFNATATATASTSADALAAIGGSLLQQNVTVSAASGGTGTANFFNSGTMDVFLSARAIATKTFNTGTATATARMRDLVNQSVNVAGGTGAGVAVASAANDGTINADLNAFASGTKAFAFANMNDGVEQDANASGASANASATFSNTSLLSFNIDVDATAIATNDQASAVASFDDIVEQNASAFGGATAVALASATNSGAINASANAFASAAGNGTSGAFAQASNDNDLIDQFATAVATPTSGSAAATAFFGNTGNINVNIGALAVQTKAAQTKATALARVSDNGIVQTVFAFGNTGVAVASITNTGNFSVNLSATASASKAFASANFGGVNTSSPANGFAIQSATGSTSATVNFTNNGNMSLNINALAQASSNTATANAFMTQTTLQVKGFDQDANVSSGTGTVATVNFTNNNTISFDLDATATGTKANASAQVDGDLVDLNANGAESVAINFNNSGSFTAQLSASANNNGAGTSRTAQADADFQDEVFNFDANASGGANSSATINFTNTGNINLGVDGFASGSKADVTAEFDDEIFELDARTANNASVSFDNQNVISLAMTGTAVATTRHAEVDLTLDDTAFDLNATATTSGTAAVTFTNSGSVSLFGDANATGVTQASASVEFDDDLFSLFVFGKNTTNTFTNNGNIAATALAFATATSGWAKADAEFDNMVVEQDASAPSGQAGSVATVTFNNSSTISILAQATANGASNGGTTTAARADATLDDEFVDQRAFAESATVSFVNSGTMSVMLTADANAAMGRADASATFDDTVFNFNANATSSIFTTSAGSVASQSFWNTNSGSILLFASASAVGPTRASADATIEDEVFDLDARGNTATSTFTNDGTIMATLLAFASAASGRATAEAEFDDSFLEQDASAGTFLGGSVATANFSNTGTISLIAQATAIGFSSASADAEISEELVEQDAQGETATVNFSNSGLLSVTLIANASDLSGNADADAEFGDIVFEQDATATPTVFGTAGAATANFANTASGTIALLASASAVGSTSASADAFVENTIIDKNANGHTAAVNITNDGTFKATMAAFASATNGTAIANANIAKGIEQTATRSTTTTVPGGSSTATFTNTSSNSLDISLMATALGVTNATATARVTKTFIFQGAFNNETATNLINNSGAINAALDASAIAAGNGTTGGASALARINTGIYQNASASGGTSPSASNTYNNLGVVASNTPSLSLEAKARAVGTTNAIANAWVSTPVWQFAQGGGTLSNTFNNNTGSVLFKADADAVGGTNAFASAFATKVWQTVNPTTAGVVSSNTFLNRNSASFVVDANAVAQVSGTGAAAQAVATARGLSQRNNGSANEPVFNAVFFNGQEDNFKGEPDTRFLVQAFASATGGSTTNLATAVATGYHVQSNTNSHAVLDVTNNSNFRVRATAIGSTAAASAFGMIFDGGEVSGSINNAGLIDVRASAQTGSALAVGVQFNSAINNSTFTNTGTINVLAIGSTTGIAVQYNFLSGHTQTATTLDQATFINDGGSVRAEVTSGGTLGFGTAFDFSNAPNPVLLNLRGTNGQGNIWGNILLSTDDSIVVSEGKTIFRGMVNGSSTFNGVLTISGSAGTLTLASTATGPSTIYVNTFTNTSTGTLAFNVTPATPSTGLGQVNAITANLAGTVQLNIAPGLYANSQTYQDVVVASTINGNFTNTSINTNTPLLSLTAIKPGDGTIDLALTRNSFASPLGLTINQMSAGLGLDGGYSTALTGAFGSMVSSLFTLSTNAYIGALEQLHGAEHVQNLRTNLWSTNLLNYALDERINAGTFSNDRTHSRDSVIRRGETVFWASFQGTDGDLEGDVEASGYDIDQEGFYAGFDHAITKDLLVGFAAGFYRSELNFTNGSDKDDEGVQLAVYAAFDTQDFYLRGNFALGYLNVDSNRLINLPTQAGIARGDYNVDTISFHAEGGKRFALDDNIYFTPFIGLDYVSAENDAFSETGPTGANLGLPENKVKSFRGDIGARLNAAFETGSKSVIVPEVFVKYRHEFKDEVLSINSSFAGIPGSGFSVISSHVDSGEIITGAGVSFSQGDRFQVKLMYTGRFNDQIEEHGIGLRLSVLLGGR